MVPLVVSLNIVPLRVRGPRVATPMLLLVKSGGDRSVRRRAVDQRLRCSPPDPRPEPDGRSGNRYDPSVSFIVSTASHVAGDIAAWDKLCCDPPGAEGHGRSARFCELEARNRTGSTTVRPGPHEGSQVLIYGLSESA
jgi:hypothetical protein